jgi:hypothetical protein
MVDILSHDDESEGLIPDNISTAALRSFAGPLENMFISSSCLYSVKSLGKYDNGRS